MFERQRERADQRIRVLATPRLQPGETIRSSFNALTRVRWFVLALPLFPILFWMESTGRDFGPWVAGAWFGLVYLVYVRFFYVVATDRRTLLLRLRRMSSKAVTDEWEVRGTPVYRDGIVSGFLTIDAGGNRLTLQVPAAFKERARELAREATEPQQSR